MPNPHPPRRLPASDSKQKLPNIRLVNPRTQLWERRYTPAPGVPRRSFYGSLDEVLAFNAADVPTKVDRRLTLADYLRDWSASLDGRTSTDRYHRGNVTRYLIPTFGEHIRLVDVNSGDLRAGYTRLRAKGGKRGVLSPRTIASAHATMRRALSQAVADERIPRNRAVGLNPNGTRGAGSRSRRVEIELPVPSPEDIRALGRAARTERLYALFMLSALTGLRQGEALALRWSDIATTEKGGVVRVSRSLDRVSRTFDDPKNRHSVRGVLFDPMLTPILRRHRAAQRRERLLAADRWQDHDLVFADPTGGPLIGSTVSHWMARLCRKAGVGAYRWHDLRHAYASGLLNQGVSIAIVSKRLGHADVSITSRIYHHQESDLDDGSARVAASLFDEDDAGAAPGTP